MLSCRDRKIIDKIEEFDGLTIKQIGMLFFPKGEFNYYYARLRMSYLFKNNFVKCCTNKESGKKIYHIGEFKELSQHRIILIDFYCNLIYEGFKVTDYKFEYRWLDGKYKSDGIFIVEDSDKNKFILVCEVDFTHKSDLRKYERVYDSEEAINKFGVFPFVFIINSLGNEYKWDSDSEVNDYIYYVDFAMKQFNKVLALLS